MKIFKDINNNVGSTDSQEQQNNNFQEFLNFFSNHGHDYFETF